MKQVITTPTRVTATTATIINHIYVSNSMPLAHSGTIELHIADHYAVFCCIKNNSIISKNDDNKHKTNVFRSFKHLNASDLLVDLERLPASVAEVFSDVNDIATVYFKLFLDIWDKHCPIIKRRHRALPTPWMTDDVLSEIRDRNAAYKSFLKNRCEASFMKYKQLRNLATAAVRKAKRYFFVQNLNNNNRSFWRHIKLCTGFGKSRHNFLSWPCHNSIQASVSANKLNKHFIESVRVVQPSDELATAESPVHYFDEYFSFQSITTSDVSRTITQLPNKSSTGSDGISAKMLKLSVSAISAPLVTIFNESFRSCCFPQIWKNAIVTPGVYKQGV
jgi:hypothetical protein